jgi:hypothetical protein
MNKVAILLSILFILAAMFTVRRANEKAALEQAFVQAEVSADVNKDIAVRLVKNGDTFCSGVVVTDSTVITAGHCVVAAVGNIFEPGFKVEVRRRDNEPTGIFVKPMNASRQMDTGAFTGNLTRFPKVPFVTDPYALFDLVKAAPYLISCGYPMGADLYCKRLIFLGFRDFEWSVYGQIIPGMSGGPVMLPDGTVIAVNSAVDGDNALVAPIINLPTEPKQ